MFALPALLSVYPDALFVQTHRAPLDAMASVSSLITILRRVFSDAVDPLIVCHEAIHYWSETLDRFLQERDRLADYRVCDVNYGEIRRDPIAAVRRICIYEHFSWLLSQKAEQRMRLVVASQAHEQSGLHRYDLSQFGLDPAEGAEAFAAYCERFDLSAQAVDRPSHCAKRLVLK